MPAGASPPRFLTYFTECPSHVDAAIHDRGHNCNDHDLNKRPESDNPHMLETRSSLIAGITDMLMESSVFNDFSATELRSVASHFGISKVDKGEIIFKEGSAGTFMCIISSGDVSVLKSDSAGNNIEIAVLRSGRVFGEMAALDGERRSATCVAATSCVLLTLSKDSLDKMLGEVPKTAAKAIRAVAVFLSRRLRMADGKLVDHQI